MAVPSKPVQHPNSTQERPGDVLIPDLKQMVSATIHLIGLLMQVFSTARLSQGTVSDDQIVVEHSQVLILQAEGLLKKKWLTRG